MPREEEEKCADQHTKEGDEIRGKRTERTSRNKREGRGVERMVHDGWRQNRG